jgi:hypothetical protein
MTYEASYVVIAAVELVIAESHCIKSELVQSIHNLLGSLKQRELQIFDYGDLDIHNKCKIVFPGIRHRHSRTSYSREWVVSGQ